MGKSGKFRSLLFHCYSFPFYTGEEKSQNEVSFQVFKNETRRINTSISLLKQAGGAVLLVFSSNCMWNVVGGKWGQRGDANRC